MISNNNYFKIIYLKSIFLINLIKNLDNFI